MGLCVCESPSLGQVWSIEREACLSASDPFTILPGTLGDCDMRRIPSLFACFVGLFAIETVAQRTCAADEPPASVVDYLNQRQERSDLASRKVLYRDLLSSTENYTGTAVQNSRLRNALVARDSAPVLVD